MYFNISMIRDLFPLLWLESSQLTSQEIWASNAADPSLEYNESNTDTQKWI